MKVLFRMLASILPGVIVGLGVIAYLERDALQEQWMLYANGESHDDADHHHDEPQRHLDIPSTQLEVAEKIEPTAPTVSDTAVVDATPAPTAPPQMVPAIVAEPVVAPVEVVNEVPVAIAAPEPIEPPKQQPVSRQDLAVVVGLEPQQSQPAPVTKPSNMAQLNRASERTSQAEPVSHPELSSLMEQQRKVTEVLTDQLPALTEQIANLSKPIENLAKQFNPLNGEKTMSQMADSANAAEDIWHVGTVERESQAEWLWNRGRQAFWEGDYELAVESYRSLLQEDEKNPDAWGELGNIYYAKKDWVRAVRAFGRAAAALIEVNRIDEAKKIIQVIRAIDPELANQLESDLG